MQQQSTKSFVDHRRQLEQNSAIEKSEITSMWKYLSINGNLIISKAKCTFLTTSHMLLSYVCMCMCSIIYDLCAIEDLCSKKNVAILASVYENVQVRVWKWATAIVTLVVVVVATTTTTIIQRWRRLRQTSELVSSNNNGK